MDVDIYSNSCCRKAARCFESLSHSGSLKVIRNDTVHKGMTLCKSLLVFCCNCLYLVLFLRYSAWLWNLGWGHSTSLKMALFNRSHTSSYRHSIAGSNVTKTHNASAMSASYNERMLNWWQTRIWENMARFACHIAVSVSQWDVPPLEIVVSPIVSRQEETSGAATA